MLSGLFSSRRESGAPPPGHRSVVMARCGMVATSQPLASLAGLDALRSGGSAADAAVTAAIVQGVVEPFSTGIGGDCFILYYDAAERRLTAFNGSGRSPADATIDAYRDRGLSEVPVHGPLAVTVPGAVDAWARLLDRHGKRSMAEALAPAIDYASAGFPVSEVIARQWDLAVRFGALPSPEAKRVFAPEGRPPRPGDVVRLADLARSLSEIQEGGSASFYEGPLGRRVAEAVRRDGGLLRAEDLAEHRGEWVEPITTSYRGLVVAEAPPNGQGLAALLALNILGEFDVGQAAWDDESLTHLRIESVRCALVDRDRFVADPAIAHVPVSELLDADYARQRAREIDPRRAKQEFHFGRTGGTDTVTIATADAEGNHCSLISSLFFPFGSGIVVPGTGIALQNRAHGFRMDPRHPNCVEPRKRPFHTIIPGMALVDGEPVLAFGVMGGNVQAQAHVQVISNIVDCGLNPQEALDAPRFHCLGGADASCDVSCEEALSPATRRGLEARGHRILDSSAALVAGGFGGGQAIARDRRRGVYWGASDSRKDGAAMGY